MKSAIIVGASSGIGGALALTLSLDGYRFGIVARRTELLAGLQAELSGPSVLPIVVTDVQPGFVDTRLSGGERRFWVASPETAARQIAAAIRGRKQHLYVTRRWRLIAWLVRIVPDVLYSKL